MGKTRNTGFSNNAIQYNSGSIAFVSGSTTLLNISSSGNIVTTGTITANTLVIQTVTSSVSFITGSTKFGSINSNTHNFTGSVLISGSSTSFAINSTALFVSSSGNIGISTNTPSTKLEIADANGIPLRIGDISTSPINQTAGYIGLSTSAYSGINGDLVLIPRANASARILLLSGSVGIGTTSTSTEANLFLGNNGASEGGQLVLQAGTSYASASHLDNYQNRFRVMSGNNVGSTAERFSIDMTSGTTSIYGTLGLPGVSVRTNTVSSIGGTYTTIGASQTYGNLFWVRWNDSGGTTDYALVGAIWYPGQANVIASTNNGGHSVTFQMSGNNLQMRCGSGTVGPIIVYQIGD